MSLPPEAVNAATALRRFGLGPRFDLGEADQAAIAADARSYLKTQLKPQAALLHGEGLEDSKANLIAAFEEQQQKKMLRDQAAQMPAAAAAPMQSMEMAGQPQPEKPMPVQRDVLLTEVQARYQKAFDDQSGLIERLVWFWSNHFAISIAKGTLSTITAGSFEREAIRPHVLGRFADMLKAVEQHPTMLFFLDNRDSIGPNSKAGQRRQKGLNENLAREIMELHTLGVNGGYTQADVTALARIITGWTFAGLNNTNFDPGIFVFNPNTHEPGASKVLGKAYAQQGQAQGEAVLADLARHPATAQHIAFKFARHFVADAPPPGLVDKLAASFRSSDGDLLALTQTLLDDDGAWATPAAKLRTPQEFLLAASRALNLPPDRPQPLIRALNELGQPLWKPAGPNGFGDTAQDWASPEGMKVRLSYASLMASQSKLATNPGDLAASLFGASLSQDTRQTVSRAESKPQGLALLLMSPEFQRR
ncbi:MAG: DUF1800 family protein [Alphaproteobacteria bacterium]|nr:DUF1800 family protein [Alphaproteobacteria bacterium]